MDLQEHLLGHVPGVLGVVRVPLDEPVESHAVALDEDAERIGVVRASAARTSSASSRSGADFTGGIVPQEAIEFGRVEFPPSRSPATTSRTSCGTKIEEVLLVASPYDAFILEEDEQLEERALPELEHSRT